MSVPSEPDKRDPYEVDLVAEARASADALPEEEREALNSLLQEIAGQAPLFADPYDEYTETASTPMRMRPFGSGSRGLVVYLVHDRARVVHVVSVTWL